MNIHEIGMPERKMWENFFIPRKILRMLDLNDKINSVMEFGCGYGTFAIPAAEIILDKVYACRACMKLSEQESSEICPISTMKNMYEIIKESDRVATLFIRGKH